jgi:hypothetical protein
MLRKFVVLVGLLVPALPVWSAADGFVDAFYVPSAEAKIAIGSLSETTTNGQGFGAHAMFPLGELFFVNGEFQRNKFSEDNAGHVNEYRAGFGAETTPDKARAAIYGEYIRLDGEGDANPDGFGLHARFTFDLIPPLKLFGEVGYVRLKADDDTIDGPEFLVGGVFSFTNYIGAFADYRISHLDGDGAVSSKFRTYDARVGVRLILGGS